MASYTRPITPALPITVAAAKVYARIDDDCQDSLVEGWIGDAVACWEDYTQRLLMPQAWVMRMDAFPAEIRIKKAPVTAVTAIKYTDAQGVLQTLAPTEYQVDIYSPVPRVRPAYGKSWPSTLCGYNAVQVEFAGGSADAASIPADIIQALMLVVGHRDKHREVVITGTIVTELPMGFRATADRHRVAWF